VSIKHISLVLENFTAKPTLKLVAIVLADHADADGICFPSYRRIASMTNQSERNVARQVKELIELGIVTKLRTGSIVNKDGKTIRLSNAYRVNAHVLERRRSVRLSTGRVGITSENVYLEQDKNERSRWTGSSTKPSYNHKVNRKSKEAGDKSVTRSPQSLSDILGQIIGDSEE
jgi:DNA-binding Lrp family transcriptional regulator